MSVNIFIPLDGIDHMPFGKHKGKPMSEVPLSYLNWLWNESDIRKNKRFQEEDYHNFPPFLRNGYRVMRYIQDNMADLQDEDPTLEWE
jgi:hypothetical protein